MTPPATYSQVLSDEKAVTCANFLTRAAAYFATHGITRIERVMTANVGPSNTRSTAVRLAGVPAVVQQAALPLG